VEIVVLKQAQKELRRCPKDFSEDIYSLFEDLSNGKKLEMPISRSLASIAPGLNELRLSGVSGELRVFYVIRVKEAIYVIHAAVKKSQKMQQQTIRLLKQRLKGIA
jgi:phage-related protein